MKVYYLHLTKADFSQSNNVWTSNASYDLYENNQYKNYSNTRSAYGTNLLGTNVWTGLTKSGSGPNYTTDGGRVFNGRYIDHTGRIDIVNYYCTITNNTGNDTITPYLGTYTSPINTASFPAEWTEKVDTFHSGLTLHVDSYRYAKFKLFIDTDQVLTNIAFDLLIEVQIGNPIIPAMYRSTRTVLDNYPEWMALREIENVPATPSLATPVSVGGRLINAVAGEWLDDIATKLDDLRFQQFIGTASEDQIAYAYAAVISDSPFLPYSIAGDGVELTRTSDLEDFYVSKEIDDVCYWDPALSKLYTRKLYTSLIVNGIQRIQVKTHIWNWFDEFGLLVDLYRLNEEANSNFKKRILDVYINKPGVALDNFKLALRRELNLWQAYSSTPTTPNSTQSGATPVVYEMRDLERNAEFIAPNGMPTRKFLDLVDELAVTYPTTWGFFQWNRAYWDQAGDDWDAYGILPYNYDATPLTNVETKSGVGDQDDLLVLKPQPASTLTNFSVNTKAKGRIKSTAIEYPRVGFDVEIYGTADKNYYSNNTIAHWFTLDLTYNSIHYYHMFQLSATSDYSVAHTTGTTNSDATYNPFRGLFNGLTYTSPGLDWFDSAGDLVILDPNAPLGPFIPGPFHNDNASNVENFGVMFPVTGATPITLHRGKKFQGTYQDPARPIDTAATTTYDGNFPNNDFQAWFSNATGSLLTNTSGTISTTGAAVISMHPKGSGLLTQVWESEHQTYRIPINGANPPTTEVPFVMNAPIILWPDNLASPANKTLHVRIVTLNGSVPSGITEDSVGEQLMLPATSYINLNNSKAWSVTGEQTFISTTPIFTFKIDHGTLYPITISKYEVFESTSPTPVTGVVDQIGPWRDGFQSNIGNNFSFAQVSLDRSDFGIPENATYEVTWLGVESTTSNVVAWIDVNSVLPITTDLDPSSFPDNAIVEHYDSIFKTYSYDPIEIKVKLIPGDDRWNPSINSGWFYDRQQEYYLYANEVIESSTLSTFPLKGVARQGAPIILATNEATPKTFRQIAIWNEATPGYVTTETQVLPGTGDKSIYVAYDDIYDITITDLNSGKPIGCDATSSTNKIKTGVVLDYDRQYEVSYKINRSFFSDHTSISNNVPHTQLYLTEATPFHNYTVHYEGSTLNTATPISLPLNALYTSLGEGFIYIDFDEHASGSFDIKISPASILADGQDYALVTIRAYDVNGDPKYGAKFSLVTTFGTLEQTVLITDHDGFASTNLTAGATPTSTLTGIVGATPLAGATPATPVTARAVSFGITTKRQNPYRLLAKPNIDQLPADGVSKISVFGRVQDGSLNPVPYANIRYRKGRSIHEVFTSADQGEIKADVQGNFNLGPFTTSSTPGYWFLAAETQYQGATPQGATPMSTNYSPGATPYTTRFPYAKTYLSLTGAGNYISSSDNDTIPVQAQQFFGGINNYSWSNIEHPFATSKVDLIVKIRTQDLTGSVGAILGSNSGLLNLSLASGYLTLNMIDNLNNNIGGTSTNTFTNLLSSTPTLPVWIKASKNLMNGQVTFYYSKSDVDDKDLVAWNQFGQTINAPIGTGSIHNGFSQVIVGQASALADNPMTGLVYAATWMFDNQVKATFTPRKKAVPSSTAWSEITGNVWTISGTTTKLISKYDVIYTLDIKAKVRANNYASGTQTVVAKWNDTNSQRSWVFEITGSGYPQLRYTTDGSTVITKTSTVAYTIGGQSDKWIRMLFLPNNGLTQNVVTFQTSDDGLNWNTLSTVTTAGTTTMFTGSADLTVGALANASNPFIGRVYYVDIGSDEAYPTTLPLSVLNTLTGGLPPTPQGTSFGSLVSYLDFTIQPTSHSSIYASTGEAWSLRGVAVIELLGHNVGDVVFWYEHPKVESGTNPMNQLPVSPIQMATDPANQVPYSYYNAYPSTYDDATPYDAAQPNVLQWRPPQWYAINRYKQYQLGLLGVGFYSVDFAQVNKTHPDYKDM